MAPPPRTLRVDLHGYDVVSALELAVVRTSEAYRNGYEAVELVHGGADVTEPVEEGRGRIKWELRRLAERGRFDNWADRSRTWPKAGSPGASTRPRPATTSPGPATASGPRCTGRASRTASSRRSRTRACPTTASAAPIS